MLAIRKWQVYLHSNNFSLYVLSYIFYLIIFIIMSLSKLQRNIIKLLKDNDGWKYLSFREIWNKLKVHHQTISNNIKYLINEGYIREDVNDEKYIILENRMVDVFKFPFYWFVQCWNNGQEIINERPIDYIPYSTKQLGIQNVNDYFFTEAKGDSMEPLIHEWDLLLVRYRTWWRNESDKLLVIHNWKAKIKEVRKKDEKILLVSLNENHANKEILSDDEIQVVGIIKKVIKTL